MNVNICIYIQKLINVFMHIFITRQKDTKAERSTSLILFFNNKLFLNLKSEPL